LYFVAQQTPAGTSYAIRKVLASASATAPTDLVVTGATMPVFALGGGTIYFYNPSGAEVRSIPTSTPGAGTQIATSIGVMTSPSVRTMAVVGTNVWFVASSDGTTRTIPTSGAVNTTGGTIRVTNPGFYVRGDFVVDGTSSVYFLDNNQGVVKTNQSTFAAAAAFGTAGVPVGVLPVLDGSDIYFYDSVNLRKVPK
jgi:hypothetical protein